MASLDDESGGAFQDRLNDDSENIDENQIEADFLTDFGLNVSLSDTAVTTSLAGTVSLLKIALLNEKSAPEILDYQSEVVSEVKSALDQQASKIQTGLKGSLHTRAFQRMALQMDFDRVRYLMLEYMRTRLFKIQRYALYIVKNNEMHSRLSQHELKFIQDFVNLDASHMSRSFLDRVPKVFRKYDEQSDSTNMVTAPNMDAFVFCQVRNDIGDIVVDAEGNDVVNFSKGDLVAVRYNAIHDLVEKGDVVLV